MLYIIAEGVHKVGFPQTHAAVQKKRIIIIPLSPRVLILAIDMPNGFRDVHTRRKRKLVAFPHDKIVKAVLRYQIRLKRRSIRVIAHKAFRREVGCGEHADIQAAVIENISGYRRYDPVVPINKGIAYRIRRRYDREFMLAAVKAVGLKRINK
jgi:hypothetical protein